MRIVLDAWPVVRLLKREAGAARVQRLIAEHDACMSSVNLGEVYHSLIRSHGRRIAAERVAAIPRVVDVEDPDWALVQRAAELKAGGGLSYPDAFCVATARRHEAPLYTGDPEIVRLADAGVEIVDLREAA
jgi:PIN domain nuclease of toxin-antitoxin system